MPVNHIHVCVKKKILPITVQTTTQKSIIVLPGTAKMRYLLYQKYHKLKIISPVEKTFRYMQQELNDFIE